MGDFNGVYSRDNLPKIKDGTYVINLDEYYDIETHLVALQLYKNDVTYFDSFGVEHIPKEIKAFINRPLFFVLRFAMLHKIKTEQQIFLEYKHMIR